MGKQCPDDEYIHNGAVDHDRPRGAICLGANDRGQDAGLTICMCQRTLFPGDDRSSDEDEAITRNSHEHDDHSGILAYYASTYTHIPLL